MASGFERSDSPLAQTGFRRWIAHGSRVRKEQELEPPPRRAGGSQFVDVANRNRWLHTRSRLAISELPVLVHIVLWSVMNLLRSAASAAIRLGSDPLRRSNGGFCPPLSVLLRSRIRNNARQTIAASKRTCSDQTSLSIFQNDSMGCDLRFSHHSTVPTGSDAKSRKTAFRPFIGSAASDFVN